MPRMPNPPRDGHPGKPPRRRGRGASDGTQPERPKPRSYGQSAEMPDSPASGDRVELEHESLEELAGEPVREEGEDEP
jgi:hypothetical protein